MFPYKSLLLGGAIAIILIGGGYFVINRNAQILENSNLQGISEGNKREVAAIGKIVAELPQDLVLPTTKLMLSAKTPNKEGFVLSASLITSESVEKTHDRYVAYFNERGYAVEEKLANSMGSIAATKQGRTIQVGIFKGENRTNTSIAIMEVIQ